jgi:hypothetical protein
VLAELQILLVLANLTGTADCQSSMQQTGC